MLVDKEQAPLSEKGFTLIETIVAVTLVSMMAIGIWSVFRTGIRSWSHGTESIDTSQRHRILLDMVRKQMASAYPLVPSSANQEATGTSYPMFKGTETTLSFVSLNSLHFQDSPGLTLVNYDLNQDSEDGSYSVVESEERYLGQAISSDSETSFSSSVSLFNNLSNCYFEYRSPDNSQDNSETWVREWDAQEKRQLPIAISLTMETMDLNGNTRKNQIMVPVQAIEAYTPSSSQRGGVRRGRGGRGGGRGGGGEPGGGMSGGPGGGFGPGQGGGRNQ